LERPKFQASPGKNVYETPTQQKKVSHGGMLLSSQQDRKPKIRSRLAWVESKTLKNNQSKKDWGSGSSGRALHSKHEALSTNPSNTKNKLFRISIL
jgi:hypothetical protein